MRYTLLLLAALALVLSACGDDSVFNPLGGTTTLGDTPGTTQADPGVTSTVIAPTTTVGPEPTVALPTTTLGGGIGDYDLAAGSTACLAGDDVACDLTYLLSPIGSPEEAIGEDCGGRGGSDDVSCSGYNPLTSTAYGYGDDPLMDALWDLCAFGNRDACDALYSISPIGSSYETFGETYGASQ